MLDTLAAYIYYGSKNIEMIDNRWMMDGWMDRKQ